MTQNEQIEAGRHFARETRKLFDEFQGRQKKAVLRRMRLIGKEEVKRTKGRLKKEKKTKTVISC